MVEYLSEKFKLKECPAHYYKEILMEDLEFLNVFQVVIFTLNLKTIKAANLYGSCVLFIYTPVIQQLNKVSIRSSREEPVLPNSDESTIVTDLLIENGVVVVAADSKIH